jgi:hypothetical protein
MGVVVCSATIVAKKVIWSVCSISHFHFRRGCADKQSRDCVNEKVAGVGGGGGTCYNCGEAGHMVCPLLLPSDGIELMIVPRMYRTRRSRLLPRRMS